MRKFLILVSSVSALGFLYTCNVKAELAERAPFNNTPRSGTFNGVDISVPEKYWSALALDIDNDSPNEIKKLTLAIKLDTFSPIYSKGDLVNYTKYAFSPSKNIPDDSQWVNIFIEKYKFSTINSSLKDYYLKDLHDSEQHLGSMSCDERFTSFGVQHCFIDKQNAHGKLFNNEFFYDSKSKFFVECTHANFGHGDFLDCGNYFDVPKLHSMARFYTVKPVDASKLNSYQLKINNIVDELIASNRKSE